MQLQPEEDGRSISASLSTSANAKGAPGPEVQLSSTRKLLSLDFEKKGTVKC